jgi:hypothetical protein
MVREDRQIICLSGSPGSETGGVVDRIERVKTAHAMSEVGQ